MYVSVVRMWEYLNFLLLLPRYLETNCISDLCHLFRLQSQTVALDQVYGNLLLYSVLLICDSLFGTATRMWAEQPWSQCSIPSKGKKFFSCQHLGSLWDPSSSQNMKLTTNLHLMLGQALRRVTLHSTLVSGLPDFCSTTWHLRLKKLLTAGGSGSR